MGVAVGLCVRQRSLNAALDVVASPLHLASVALQLELVLASFAALEPQDAAVLADKHHAGTRLNLFTCEIANSSLWHSITAHSAFEPLDPCP